MVDMDAQGRQGQGGTEPAGAEVAQINLVGGGDVLEWWMWIHRKRPAEEAEENPLMKKLRLQGQLPESH